MLVLHVFFFKQKTAYEMRISDWSSDVCSSDLLDTGLDQLARDIGLDVGETDRQVGFKLQDLADLRAGEGGDFRLFLARPRRPHGEAGDADDAEIGRASGRERVCQYV